MLKQSVGVSVKWLQLTPKYTQPPLTLTHKHKMSNEGTSPVSRQAAVSGSAFSIHDLKCGNILNYDTAEGEILPTVIDWQDLKWLTEDPRGFNLVHSPIPLTQNHLRLFGAIEHQKYWLLGDIELAWITTDEHFEMEWQKPYQSWKIIPFKFVHELQNFYYCLTGVMLSLS